MPEKKIFPNRGTLNNNRNYRENDPRSVYMYGHVDLDRALLESLLAKLDDNGISRLRLSVWQVRPTQAQRFRPFFTILASEPREEPVAVKEWVDDDPPF